MLTPGTLIITSACENPEVAFRWADGFFERETTLRSVFGVLDEHWLWAEDGQIGINGKQAIWNRGKTFDKVQNFAWAQTGISYRPNDLRLGEVADNPEENLEVILYSETKKNYEPYIPSADEIIPPLFFEPDASMELAEMSTTIYDYVNQMTARFIIGDVDLEKEWDTYLATLDSMGLPRFIELYQEAYNAKK